MNLGAEDKGAPAPSASTLERLDVEGGDGVYFLTDPETHDIRGTLLDDGGGWWRCRTPRGNVRKLFVPAEVEDACLYVAQKVGGS